MNFYSEQRFRAKIAEKYDEFHHLACPNNNELYSIIIDEIKSFASQKDLKVLEIGCGTGKSTNAILEQSAFSIEALDHSKEMIDRVLMNVAKENHNRVNLLEIDLLDYLKSQPNETFDFIFSVYTLHNCTREYRHKALQEIFRILKPGLLFINADRYVFDDESELNPFIQWQIKEMFEILIPAQESDLLQEWVLHQIKDISPEIIMQRSKMEKVAKKIGFSEQVEIYRKQIDSVVIYTK